MPMPKAFKNTGCNGSSGERLGKTEENPGMAADKSQQQKEVIEEARNKSRKVHCASLMDLCHLKDLELEPQYQKY